jgi:hypothetical protein
VHGLFPWKISLQMRHSPARSITIGIRLYGPKINNDKATDTNRQYIYYYYYYTTKVYIYMYIYIYI